MDRALKDIFSINLGVKKKERVLVFTDILRADELVSPGERKTRIALRKIAKKASDIGKDICSVIYAEYPSPGGHGVEPPRMLWRLAFGDAIIEKLKENGALKKILSKKITADELIAVETIIKSRKHDAVDCVVALSNYSTSHTRFRKLLTECAGVRYASMPLFEEGMLRGAMRVDWKALEKRTKKVAAMMKGGDMVYINTPNGTSVSFSIKDRSVKPDTGILTKPGSFGNLPAGEAYLAPVEGTAKGRLVLDWAPTRKLKSHVILNIKKGMVIDIEGKEEFADQLRKKIKQNPLCGNIAELGIGTNDKAKRPDNILESEKILGTIHIAIGDNSTFGGRVSVPFHQDFVFFKPCLTIEKKGKMVEILKDGRLKTQRR